MAANTLPLADKGIKSLLLTDLYQLTMLHSYFKHGMSGLATFEFFVRELPPERNFLVAAGLEQALEFLEQAQFSEQELQWLLDLGLFDQAFVDFLAGLRFEGDVYAMPEGTLFFSNEPIFQVTAPLAQAQLMETRLINFLHFQSLIASKAARCTLVAPDRLLVDFGLRRAHGSEAGLLAARATYLAGFAGSSTVLGGYLMGIPTYGTMAHSFIQAHQDESVAYEHFSRTQPDNSTLLIDTYDTEAGAQRVVELAGVLAKEGIHIRAVRLDSGDLEEHARKVRRILDQGGLEETKIFSSGNLDEYKLEELVQAGAPIDGFGVGTKLDTSADVPYLDCAYKLTEYDGRATRKRSESKMTWPGRKQVYRHLRADGSMAEDTITLYDDQLAGEPLLQMVLQAGKRVSNPEPLTQIRQRVSDQLEKIPATLKSLDSAVTPYPVKVAPALQKLAAQVDQEIERHLKTGPRGEF